VNIAIVTPWLGHHELAADYVAAVLPEFRGGDEIIIVDNGDAPELPFYVHAPAENLGFAGGSNLGLDIATTDAVLFLNNDIALGRKGWLDEIRQALEPGVLVGPLRDGQHAAVDGQPMPYIDGWCLAGMRDDLLGLGGFDLGLQEPAYYSDNLLCLEARAAGMTLRDARVGLVHKLNVTAGSASAPDVQAASAANRDLYVQRAREILSTVTPI
jgi:GT2 family glycosyltransferase